MAAILSLEFSELDCKVALVDQARGGNSVVKSLTSFPLPKPEDATKRVAECAQALREHLKGHRIISRLAVLVIPKNFVMVRTVTLPSTVDDEIAGMAKFEAERHIPFNAERHIIAYHVLSRNGAQGSDVLLAAVDQPIAQEYLDICTGAGLRVTSITVSSVALYNAYAVGVEKSAAEGNTVMVLNIGKSAMDLVIATNGNITFVRGSTTGVARVLEDLQEATGKYFDVAELAAMDALEPQLYFKPETTAAMPPAPDSVAARGLYDALPSEGAERGTEPPGPDDNVIGEPNTAPTGTDDPNAFTGFTVIDPATPAVPSPSSATAPENKGAVVFSGWLNKVLQEVKRTVEFASREFSSPMVNHIYLCGEGALVGRLADYFQANFNVETTVFDPLTARGVVSKLKKSDPIFARTFALALGGAAAALPSSVRVNLLPGAYTEARSAKRQQVSYMVTGFLVLAAMVAGYVYLSDVFTRNNELLEQFQARNKADRARVTDLKVKKERLRIIKENVQDDRGALDVLRILSEKTYIPEKVAITSFDYKRGDYVKLEGDAKDLPSANQIVTDLRNTGFFEQATLGDVEANKPVRGRGGATVTGWRATFTFPKPVKKKEKAPVQEKNDGFE